MPAEIRAKNPPDAPKNLPQQVHVVEFLLGKEHYAIDLYDVKEVVDYTTITRLPDTPAYIKGIMDLRGEITTIIDLMERLNIPHENSRTGDDNRRIIILDEKLTDVKMGIIVDDVLSVSTFDNSDVDCSSASIYTTETAVMGIIRKKARVRDKEVSDLIVWIDISRILRDAGCVAA
ncbi:MAG: chemotaxis protein CheW [Methanoregula sp.]|jgi:purine-binding chemotaxis protein CheW